MATYNGGRFLRPQLQSILEQTQQPAELVICDDGSKDNTLSTATEFATSAPFPVRIEQNAETLGYRKNFMRAATLCRSELIAFSDQDDIWFPQKLEACAQQFENPQVLMTYHNAQVFEENDHLLGELWQQASPRTINPVLSLDPWFNAAGFTVVFRRSLLALHPLWSQSKDKFEPDFPMAHDEWISFLASALGIIAYIPNPLARYRQHATNLYGWGGSPAGSEATSLRLRFARLLRVGGIDDSCALEMQARARVKLLENARELLPERDSKLAQCARDRYHNLALRYNARRRLYTTLGLADRYQAFRELTSMRAYAGDKGWNLRVRTGIKDFLLGVPFGHLAGRDG